MHVAMSLTCLLHTLFSHCTIMLHMHGYMRIQAHPPTHIHTHTHMCTDTHAPHPHTCSHTHTHTPRTKPILQDTAHSPAGFWGHLSLERLREFFLQTQFVPLKYVGPMTVKKQIDYVCNDSLDRKHHHHIYSQSPFTVGFSQPWQLHQQRCVYRLTSAHSQISHSTLSWYSSIQLTELILR